MSRSYDGIDVEKDADKAFDWTQRAAEHGDRDGQFNLACFYEEEIGTPVNMEKAMHWCKKAAEQNHDLAIRKGSLCGQPSDFASF